MNQIMKKSLLLFLLATIFSSSSKAQTIVEELRNINEERIEKNKTAMKLLGGWSVANIATGTYGRLQTGGTTRYFHEMNAAWNSVNLAIAGFGYYGAKRADTDLSLTETVRESNNMDKILLLNTGLNVGYMATGAYLWERGIRKQSDRQTGYGQSLILQGAFLFVFDTLFYLSRSSERERIRSVLESIQFNGTGISYNRTF